MVLDSFAGTRAQTGRTFLKVLCSLIGIWAFSTLPGCTTTKVVLRLSSHDPLPPGTEIQVIDLPDARLLEPPASFADSALSVVDDPSSKVIFKPTDRLAQHVAMCTPAHDGTKVRDDGLVQ